MKNKPEVKESEKALAIQTPQDLGKPKQDTQFAKASAELLVDIIEKNHWSRSLGGSSKHIQYEGWQTAGKYYGYMVKTYDAEPVEIAGIQGFRAMARVVNEVTGIEIGGAEAYCMRDEPNWKTKPIFQLASMAQTRAGSKALRQILGFVVALAGYSPTPQEEITGNEVEAKAEVVEERPVTVKQVEFIIKLLDEKGFTEKDLQRKYKVESVNKLTASQASTIIENLMTLPGKIKKEVEESFARSQEAELVEDVDKGLRS